MNYLKETLLTALVALGMIGGLTAGAQGANPQYKLLKTIPIGGAGGWDYLTADPEAQRLFVSHGTKIVVVDTKEDKVIGEITNTPGVHGFAVANDLQRGFSSNGQANTVSIIDLAARDPSGKFLFKELMTVKTGGNPDAILYEPTSGEVWTCNGRSNTFTAIDAKTGKVVSDGVALGGKPETGQADPEANRVYINLEDKSEVAAVDLKEHKVVAHWPLAPASGPTGMAIDRKLHRLIIGASKMVLMDAANGKVVSTLDCGQGVDAAAFDPETHLGFVSAGGSGTVTIATVEADKLTPVQTLTTERGARTMTVDTKTHRIYLANNPVRNDPNGFKVLVYGIDEAGKN